ncbi:MAG TPA: thioredoxin domain-containing protein, partial [Pyrinomonadaceae bacterium]|nr:thioredoxin domain-containing protein [Pyrinomonadaceae bacterium]
LLAIVNGQNVTTAELDPSVREQVEGLPDRIADARRRILEMEINTLLLETEARKRKLTAQQLYDSEVTRKLTDPPAAEVTKFIQENRDRIEEKDPKTMREQVIMYLRGERENKLSETFVKRLRTANPIVPGADLRTPSLAPTAVLATVAGRPITAAIVSERLKPIIYKLQLDTYLIEKPALERTINDLLLLAEANRLNVPSEEMVRKEISDKVRPPTEAAVKKFYDENKERINGEFSTVQSAIATYLENREREKLEQELAQRLRKGADVKILVTQPEPPVQTISVDDDPSRGDAAAPVTVVEFTDFQCPACASMHPVIENVLKSYGTKVRFVVRDFPLNIHPNSRKAAEAANAAHAQGKFFEYAALLFKRQNALDVPSLKKYASELGLNRAVFDAALDGGKYAAEVKKDLVEGEIYGVESTPTIFVNGIVLQELSAEGLREAIDKGLAGNKGAKASGQ